MLLSCAPRVEIELCIVNGNAAVAEKALAGLQALFPILLFKFERFLLQEANRAYLSFMFLVRGAVMAPGTGVCCGLGVIHSRVFYMGNVAMDTVKSLGMMDGGSTTDANIFFPARASGFSFVCTRCLHLFKLFSPAAPKMRSFSLRFPLLFEKAPT